MMNIIFFKFQKAKKEQTYPNQEQNCSPQYYNRYILTSTNKWYTINVRRIQDNKIKLLYLAIQKESNRTSKRSMRNIDKHNYIIRWRRHNLPWILYIIHQLLRDFVSMERNKKQLDQKSNSSQYCPQASFKQEEMESEIENENEINEEHKYIKNKFKNTKQGEKTIGSWSLEQNIKYLKFLQRNKEWIKCPLQRRRKRIFQKMYRKIKTRTAGQCRSHHQKTTKKHPEIEMLIDELKVKIANYKYQIFKQMWEKKKQTEQKISIQTTAKQTNINQQFVVAKLGQKLYIQIKASYIKEW